MKNLSKCSEIRENTLVKRDYKALRSMTEPERKIEKLRRRKWLERTWHIT
ncbi:MAG: hypothetical protein GY861_07955, partial [bacterium]|nr:hypothetical protein [bacterium]